MFNPEQYPMEIGRENPELHDAEEVFERYRDLSEKYKDGKAGKMAKVLPMLALAAFMSAGQVPKNAEAFFGYSTSGIADVEDQNNEHQNNQYFEEMSGIVGQTPVYRERTVPVRDLIRKARKETKKAPGEYREIKRERKNKIEKTEDSIEKAEHNTQKVGKNVEREIRRIRDQIKRI